MKLFHHKIYLYTFVLLLSSLLNSANAFDLGTQRADTSLQFRMIGGTSFTMSFDALVRLDSATYPDNPCVNSSLSAYKFDKDFNAVLTHDVYIWACELNISSKFVANLNPVRVAEGLPVITTGTLVEFYKIDTGSRSTIRAFSPDATVDIVFPNLTSGKVSKANCPSNFDYEKNASFYTCSNMNTYPGDYDVRNITNGLDIGTSEVDASMFGYKNGTAAYLQDMGTVIWSLPVSVDLRDVLQAAQFKVASACHPSNAAYSSQATHPDGTTPMTDLNGVAVTNRESEACQPSLSKTQVASLFSGMIQDWRYIIARDGRHLGDIATAYNLLPRLNNDGVGNNYRVFICGRPYSSGALAAYKSILTKTGCMDYAPSIVTGDLGNIISGTHAFQVTCPGLGHVCGMPTGQLFDQNTSRLAAVSASDVADCLTLHTQDANNSNEDGTWAIGMLSSQYVANDAATDNTPFGILPNMRFRHIKINGMMASVLNVANGWYPHISEMNIQTHTTASGSKSIAMRQAVVDGLSATYMATSPIVTASGINSGVVHPWGQGGYVLPLDKTGLMITNIGTSGIPGINFPLNALEVSTYPFTPLSKHTSGVVNNCADALHAGGIQFMPSLPINNATNSNATSDALLP